jgi:asparagine synthase (glutamine-hydrolysing)
MSDVPLGVFLSGGVDSSAIAALVKRSTAEPVKTFSVGYTEDRYSELGYAARVSRAIGTDYHEVRIGIDDFFGALPELIWYEDEPITWPSSVSLHFVSELAAQQVKVVLTGEGSDELFGGYERYRWHLLNSRAAKTYALLPRGLCNSVQNFVKHSSVLRGDLRRKLLHTFVARSASLESLYLDNFYSAFDAAERRKLIDGPTAAPYENYLAAFEHHPHDSLLARMLYADQKTYLVQLLMKQDRMSMSASIESRVPLLDHKLVEFASTIPDRFKIRGNVQKYIFKKAVEDLLPKEIVYRKKMGFPTPLRAWLRDDRAKPIFSALLDRSSFLSALIERAPVENLIQLHLTGQQDATDRIWRLLTLQLWGDIFITGRRDRQDPCYGFENSKLNRDRMRALP